MSKINNLPNALLYSCIELFVMESRRQNWQRLLFNVAVPCINFTIYQECIYKCTIKLSKSPC